MPCTTILVGKNASYDGSTLMARNEDSPSGQFTRKKYVSVTPDKQPRHYKSVISGVEIDLPDNPMRYTAMPNAHNDEGIWGEAGVNECNVAMSETETITSNPRVLGADPLVPGGIGEEDMLTIVLPYIHSAREGVKRLGMLLEKYGTYEMNGIGFQDIDEIWWLESIGGHHWMAKRVPDDAYVLMPNQLGIDCFDFVDALGEQKDCMCSRDLADFVRENHLSLGMNSIPVKEDREFDARAAFGSHSDSDHTYNTPRAWSMARYLNPTTYTWDGLYRDFTPESDNIPWSFVPEKKITVEDIKYVLSLHYQGTPFDVYAHAGDKSERGKYRPIGINRNNFLKITQLRPYVPGDISAVEWIAEGSNPFNTIVPFYANVNDTPRYLRDTDGIATTENFYWANRFIAAMADPHFNMCITHIERYRQTVTSKGHRYIAKFDKASWDAENITEYLENRNLEIARMLKEETDKLLGNVLYRTSNLMKNGFARSDG